MKKVVYHTNKFSLVKLTDSDGRNMFNITYFDENNQHVYIGELIKIRGYHKFCFLETGKTLDNHIQYINSHKDEFVEFIQISITFLDNLM